MSFTVFGAGGFIGSHLVRHLQENGAECFAPERGDRSIFTQPLGHVIYCIGLTADFRKRPFDTIEAHVCLLKEVLRRARFDSFLYLSSTRVYRGLPSGDEEASIAVNPQDPDDLYNLSKLAGEALCFAAGRAGTRVVRMSNVYGSGMPEDNFLAAVMREAVGRGAVRLRTGRDAAKDYVDIADVVPVLTRIAEAGQERLYNLASGANISNGTLIDRLQQLTSCQLSVAPDAPAPVFPPIRIDRVRREFDFAPGSLMEALDRLVQNVKEELIACD
ncbi:SDR family oxidoreductase [Rhodospirillaceae bacterium SYSU D60014]|uniref:NAD-dependent epimerase/dehydratase family protein n=1 Tax=Virgifigura deserti TaxID=2268457 RepID=UPI000E671C5A